MLPSRLRRLVDRFVAEVRGWTDALEAEGMTLAAWKRAMLDGLRRYHAAALMAGQGSSQVSPQARAALKKTVASQLKYLNNFAVEIQDAPQFQPGWKARAELYAKGIGQSYWRGATKLLPLPAMPRDGTSQCLGNCNCAWSITELPGDGNYDCTWVMGAAEHCQTCQQRAADWAPLKIREGRIV